MRLSRLHLVPLLALLVIPVRAGVVDLYSNGVINGTVGGIEISSGGNSPAISDSFVLPWDSIVTGLSNLGIWVSSEETLTSLDWAISTGPDGMGTVEGFATNAAPSSAAELLPTASYGVGGEFNIYNVSFLVLDLNLEAGTYYLTLEDAVGSNIADGVFWDQNDGPSTAAIYVGGDDEGTVTSNSFEIDGTVTPEPTSLVLLVIGFVAVAAKIILIRTVKTP